MKKIIKLGRKGFSLIELMFGVSILSVVVIVLLLAYINCMLLNESSRNLTIAANDAQYVLEQIKGLDYEDIEGYCSGFDPLSFNNLPNETETVEPTSVVEENHKKVTVNVSWTERQNPRSFSLATYFAE